MTENQEEPWFSEEDIQRLREAVESAAIAYRQIAEAFVNAVGPVFTQLAEQFRDSLTLIPPPEEDCPFDCSSCLFFCFSEEDLPENSVNDNVWDSEYLPLEQQAREEGFDE